MLKNFRSNAPLVLGIALCTIVSFAGCRKAADSQEHDPAVIPSTTASTPRPSLEEEFGKYTYRGISPGESRHDVDAKLKALGFVEQNCSSDQPTIQCNAKSEADSSAPTLNLSFRKNRLTGIWFWFDYNQFQRYIDVETHANGKPTLGLHEREIGGQSVDWADRSTEPCKHIRITDTGGTIEGEIRQGMFNLELHDTSQHPTMTINNCSKTALTNFRD